MQSFLKTSLLNKKSILLNKALLDPILALGP
jgi:hypothetical protein